MERISEKTYGIKEGYHKGVKKFFVVSDGRTTGLCYSSPAFALTKAEGFVKHVYKDFTDFQGNAVKFTFKQQ
jgi:hypothetical protein